jgi:hypothetical protein
LALTFNDTYMQVFVRTLSGETVALTVATSDSVADVKRLIEAAHGIPVDEQRLLRASTPLRDSCTVAECGLSAGATLHLSLRLVGGGRCALGDCPKRTVLIIGDCRFCSKSFCAGHRLPETHSCPQMETCRQASFEKNKEKLMGEKCVARKTTSS